MKMRPKIKDELLSHPLAFITYQAQRLFCSDQADPGLLMGDPFIQGIIESLEDWPQEVMKAHNRPQLAMHRLALLADLGVTRDYPGIEDILAYLETQMDDQGIPLSKVLMPKAFGGSGEVEPMWFICDFPMILYSMEKMGHPSTKLALGMDYLESLIRDNGFPCVTCSPKIKGPGSKAHSCPIANLFSLRALSVHRKDSPVIKPAIEMLLKHWEERGEKKYFLFGIGTDYQKLKYPLIWYNLLHVLWVISLFPGYEKDFRVLEMADLLLGKFSEEGWLTPESIYMNYKTTDFGSRKEPSALMTLKGYEVLHRLGLLDLG